MFVEIAAPAVIMLEQQFCGSRNIHGAESTGWQWAGKGRRREPAHATGVLILCGCQRGGGACPTARVLVRSGGAGVDVRLGLKDGRGSSAAVLVPQGRYVQLYFRRSLRPGICLFTQNKTLVWRNCTGELSEQNDLFA